MSKYQPPRSPHDEIQGIVYFLRLCDKIRLHAAGKLHPDYHENLGKGMDLWTCQFLQIDYQTLNNTVLSGAADLETLELCGKIDELQATWWNSYMRNRGFRDDLAAKLVFRKEEAGWQDRDDIITFFDFIDADEGRA